MPQDEDDDPDIQQEDTQEDGVSLKDKDAVFHKEEEEKAVSHQDSISHEKREVVEENIVKDTPKEKAAETSAFIEPTPPLAPKARFAGVSKSPKRSSSKGQSKQKSGLYNRIQALSDNVKSKNLQITELNRNLAAMFETSQKSQKQMQRKNRELERQLKRIEKELTIATAIEPNQDILEQQQQPTDEDKKEIEDKQLKELYGPSNFLKKKRIVLIKKVAKRKSPKKQKYKAAVKQFEETKLSNTETLKGIDKIKETLEKDEMKSDSNDDYSNFEEESEDKPVGDVSTQKKAVVSDADDYSSIEENDAIDNEVEKKL